MTVDEARAVLALTPGATPDAVRAAYLAAAWRHHPDRAPGTPGAAFHRVQEAYAVLKRPPTPPGPLDPVCVKQLACTDAGPDAPDRAPADPAAVSEAAPALLPIRLMLTFHDTGASASSSADRVPPPAEAVTVEDAAPGTIDPGAKPETVMNFAQRRTYLHGALTHPCVPGFNVYLAETERLRRDEKAVGYWAGTRRTPAPAPDAVPAPEPERSYVHGLSATFETDYCRWPDAARRRPHRCALLCAGGRVKLLRPLAHQHPADWTVIHPDKRVTDRLKAERAGDPVALDLARRFAPHRGRDRDDPRLLAEMASQRLRIRTAPIEHTGLPPAAFDLVVIDHAHLCADLGPVYTEVQRLLRLGGMVIVTGHLPILPGGAIDDLVWDLIELLKPVFTAQERSLYSSFRKTPFPFRPAETVRLRDHREDFPWTSAASWNLKTVAAQLSAWPAYQRALRSKSSLGLEVEQRLESISLEWGKAVTKRRVEVPIIARAGVKLA